MANTDRPNGFTPVKTLSGAPVSTKVRTVGCANSDIFVGDAIYLSSGLAAAATTEDQNILGVAVGFGKTDDASGFHSGAYNPDDIDTTWFDASAGTYTDFYCYYVPVEDMLFEAQFDGAPTSLVVGAGELSQNERDALDI